MSMESREFDIVKGVNKSRSRYWSSQDMENMYIQEQPSGRTALAALPWPGSEALPVAVDFDPEKGGKGRGIISVPKGDLTYIISLVGTQIIASTLGFGGLVIGEVPGEYPVKMATDGNYIFIGNYFDTSVAYINRKFIVSGRGQIHVLDFSSVISPEVSLLQDRGVADFYVSDVDDPFTFREENGANAELSGDTVSDIFYFQEKIIVLGLNSVEFFFDDPLGGNPPLKPIKEISTSSIGVGVRISQAQSENFSYFLGKDSNVYRINGIRIENITPPNICQEIISSAFSFVSGSMVKINGGNFYVLNMTGTYFIGDDIEPNSLTLAYSEDTGSWSRLTTGDRISHKMVRSVYSDQGNIFPVTGNFFISQEDDLLHFSKDGELSFNSSGEKIKRTIVTAPIHMNGARFLCNRVRFLVETGIENDEALTPSFKVSYSVDGGRTFSDQQDITITSDDSTNGVADWYGVVDCYDLVFKIETDGDFFFSLHGATADIKGSGY